MIPTDGADRVVLSVGLVVAVPSAAEFAAESA